jgi:hypothetical protein
VRLILLAVLFSILPAVNLEFRAKNDVNSLKLKLIGSEKIQVVHMLKVRVDYVMYTFIRLRCKMFNPIGELVGKILFKQIV